MVNEPSVRVVFLDRDGVINKNRDDYVKSIQEFVFLPNAIKAISKIRELGYMIILVTNQSAVNRGIISLNELNQIHKYMIEELEKNNCKIDKIYFCPHRPDENCECRKPKMGLLKQAIEDFKIDISKSWLIGDSETDIVMAKKAGLKQIQIERNGDLMRVIKIIQGNEF